MTPSIFRNFERDGGEKERGRVAERENAVEIIWVILSIIPFCFALELT